MTDIFLDKDDDEPPPALSRGLSVPSKDKQPEGVHVVYASTETHGQVVDSDSALIISKLSSPIPAILTTEILSRPQTPQSLL